MTNPTLVVEVLPDSSEAYDRGDKFRHYRALPSVQLYLLLAQDRMQAELFVRQPDDSWNLSVYADAGERIPLAAVGAELLLGEVYDKVELEG